MVKRLRTNPKKRLSSLQRCVRLDHLHEPILINLRGVKARVTIPFLRRFEADWATEMYLRRSLRNRKGHLKRKVDKRKATGVDIDITLDDSDAGHEDDEGGSSDAMSDD